MIGQNSPPPLSVGAFLADDAARKGTALEERLWETAGRPTGQPAPAAGKSRSPCPRLRWSKRPEPLKSIEVPIRSRRGTVDPPVRIVGGPRRSGGAYGVRFFDRGRGKPSSEASNRRGLTLAQLISATLSESITEQYPAELQLLLGSWHRRPGTEDQRQPTATSKRRATTGRNSRQPLLVGDDDAEGPAHVLCWG